MPANPLRIVGYEKFWASLLGGAMATSVTTFALWGFSTTAPETIAAPTPEAITAAITGAIATIFSAVLVLLTANTNEEPTP
jgi:Mg2+/Co2+ transporter CorB